MSEIVGLVYRVFRSQCRGSSALLDATSGGMLLLLMLRSGTVSALLLS